MTIISHVAAPCLRPPSSRLVGHSFVRNLSNPPRQIGSGRYQEGDRVLALYKDGYRIKTKLLSPLKHDGKNVFGSTGWTIKHEDIIGQPARRVYVNAIGQQGQTGSIRVVHPTLDDFVSLAPRTVTPIYASYSAFMTSLLDIHVDPPHAHNDPRTSEHKPLEILESGTGHGSLTIHLAKAVAAANPPPPSPDELSDDETLQETWQTWKKSRRAVVHTVEFKASRSKDAEKAICSYRGGLYWPHIDFHSGDVGQWVQNEIRKRTDSETSSTASEFLDIVCLDLPNVHEQLQHVHRAMKNHAQLLVYVPQITQIAACQHEIDRLGLPFNLQRIIELGEGISNGRRWDVRFVRTRAEQKSEQDRVATSPDATVTSDDSSEVVEGLDQDETETTESVASSVDGSKFPTMVCRPMVGNLTMGGAFVGLWRKADKTR